MIYTYLGALVGFSFVILSMAEMASMYVQFLGKFMQSARAKLS